MTNIDDYFDIYDNKGESVDRYTAVFKKTKPRISNGMPYSSAITMSESPSSPTGIYMHVEVIAEAHLGKRLPAAKLPKDCQTALLNELTN